MRNQFQRRSTVIPYPAPPQKLTRCGGRLVLAREWRQRRANAWRDHGERGEFEDVLALWNEARAPGAAIRYARGMIGCYSGGIVVEVEDRWPTPAQRQELFDAIAWKFEKVPSGRIGAEPVELRTLAANAEGENVEDALVRWRHTRHGDKPMTRLRPDTRALPSYAPSGLCTDRGGR